MGRHGGGGSRKIQKNRTPIVIFNEILLFKAIGGGVPNLKIFFLRLDIFCSPSYGGAGTFY